MSFDVILGVNVKNFQNKKSLTYNKYLNLLYVKNL